MSDWTAQIHDEKLRRRVREVLCDLELLAEGATSSTEGRTSHGKPGTKRPPGARLDFDAAKPPPRERLYGWHVWHLRSAVGDELRLLRCCYQAEHDVMRVKWGMRDWRKGAERDRDYESPENFERRIITFYEGVDSQEVGMIYEERHPAVIEKVRRDAGLDPRTGRPKDGWHTWTEVEKVEVIASMLRRDMSQRQIAAELGLRSKTPIQKRWQRAQAA